MFFGALWSLFLEKRTHVVFRHLGGLLKGLDGRVLGSALKASEPLLIYPHANYGNLHPRDARIKDAFPIYIKTNQAQGVNHG